MTENEQKKVTASVEGRCCKENCLKRLPLEVRSKFRRDFSLCKSFEARCAFIYANTKELPVLDGKRQKFSRSHYVSQKRVCQKSFQSILEISHKKIEVAMRKYRAGSLRDCRGGANRFLSEESRKAIVDHINSYSHHRRETSKSLQLDPELNIATVFRSFQEQFSENHPGVVAPSIWSYKKVFKSMGLKFNILQSKGKLKDSKRHLEMQPPHARKGIEKLIIKTEEMVDGYGLK